ncbi:MAG TPA: restriction endonuclease subunit S [Pirellulaceae bacterium]|nr:restriction endonuclease subunit S [Pirellulaceae bacterium]
MSKKSSDIPPGWESVSLADVTIHSTEKAEPSAFRDSQYLGLEHIESGTNRMSGTGDAGAVKSTKAVFRSGDVLYGKLRPYLNKVCQPDFDGVCSTDILVFPQSDELDNRYLLHFLSRPSTSEYATQNASGINLPRISAKVLGEIEFPLAPLAEQRRIVAKIEALQARTRQAREALAEVGPLLEQFRQSLLAAAFRGDLTADWRAANPNVEPATELLNRIRQERQQKWEEAEIAKYAAKDQQPPKDWKDKYKEPEPLDELAFVDLPELPDGWGWTNMDSVSYRVSVGHVGPTSKFYCDADVGIPFLRSQNVRPRQLSTDGLNYITPEFHETLQKSQLHAGDILVVRVGANRGDTCRVPDGYKELNCANIVFGQPCGELSPFIELFCQSRLGQTLLLGMSTGSAQGVINTKSVAELPIPVCSYEEQGEIIATIDAALDGVNEIVRAVSESESDLTQLDQSILAQAFRGELVPQDPNDEPASVLLERIRQQREALSVGEKNGKKTTRRRGKKKAEA